jgi:NADH-quinone oxidoreductase subunit L
MLRAWPVIEASMIARIAGVVVGLATAIYAAAVVRVHTDAKGALAHATLAQVGLILAEICLGWTTLALTHLVCHAFLRLGQYLKAPNTIHDTHRVGHSRQAPGLLQRWSPRLAARIYVSSLHRLRLDDRIDAAFAPVMALASGLDRADRWLRRTLTLDRPRP